MATLSVKLIVGGYKYPVAITPFDKAGNRRLKLQFRYNKLLIAEVKNMGGARWQPNGKYWHIDNSARNRFQLQVLTGEDPYERYDRPLLPITSIRPLYEHQLEMLSHVLVRHHGILACEMGTGKSLVAIEAIERLAKQHNIDDPGIWYVGPVSGVKAVSRELVKWGCKVQPKMMTYNKMTTTVQNWTPGLAAPKIVVFDECSCIKNPDSQRSKAALHLTNAMREEHGDEGCYSILMSGTPSPKTPVDWWHQVEVACPGFLAEGDVKKFKRRLCLSEMKESLAGGIYPHLITWLDDSSKCGKCGAPKDSNPDLEIASHDTLEKMGEVDHKWSESVNEVAYLYERMAGLVLVKFKKNCLDLPEKQYRTINIKPSLDTLRLAQAIKKRSSRVITAMTLLRELSDGFQYYDEETGRSTCNVCKGTGKYVAPEPENDVDTTAPNIDVGGFSDSQIVCKKCDGSGLAPIISRAVKNLGSPKDDAFRELLTDHEEYGRFLVWGGFTGTIERLVDIAHTKGWATLRVDGKGYKGTDKDGSIIDAEELLSAMDISHPRYKELLEKYPYVCFVGHPQAAGMGITITASPTALYYSNVFNGEARMQSEDRIHRAGMDTSRGCTIIDLIHLPTDQIVLDNLKGKKRLQALTMNDLVEATNTADKATITRR